MNDIRIAAVIFNSPLNRIRNNLERMVQWIRAAKKRGANLICFPELNITGYTTQPDIKAAARPVAGFISQRLHQMASAEQITILAGIAEKDDKRGTFASHLVVTPQGIAGVYRKLHLAPPEKAVFSSGNNVPLFELHGIKFGIQLCYDTHFPELSTRMAVEGTDVIFMPHASPRGTPEEKLHSWLRHLTARAFDNSVYIIACNQNGDNQKELQFPGLAVVIGPSGDILEKNVSGQDGLVIADLKASTLESVRNHPMRYFLPNRKPEIYKANHPL